MSFETAVHQWRAGLARLDDAPLQALGVLKQRGTNAVAVASAVRDKVAEIQKALPDGMKIDILSDTTVFIQDSIHEIELELEPAAETLVEGFAQDTLVTAALEALGETSRVRLEKRISFARTSASARLCGTSPCELQRSIWKARVSRRGRLSSTHCRGVLETMPPSQ